MIFLILLFKYSCVHFPSTTPHNATHPHLQPSILLPLTLSMGPLYMVLDSPSSIFPHYPSPLPPLITVSLFFISMSLVIFCLLFSSVDYVPVKGEIIWYLSLTTWLISLSIMFSSSIHAVAKGISSFFLSAA